MTDDCIDTIGNRPGRAAWLWGLVGVTAFSFTLPATRLAVAEIDGTLVGLGWALVAAGLAALLLAATRQRLPARRYWGRLALTALGVVFGFPFFSAWAQRMRVARTNA